ncbi:molecular chaperone [Escherichia coli]|uniref:fimbrial biogenesis chaperone n=1 Tax=Escherichia coli TaxID=562 RepID=UPI000176AE73|nr:molecular chaperone [Escherichia coli]AIF65142.1 IS3, transposase orfA [Escherichia coli B7A]ENC00453.1 gram-negative pili assembly chaperone, C-terminal domain protein [Escherichia coli P0299438.11]ENC22042.1 gram-negative pili assembly chaperone, C-terminal domain protein [Escherichia coli P0299438.6]ENC28400.1 gram-negative pili assembly chaperone, C-terminal domain protein [Escherichia coli P0299438.8]EST01372.1 putative fimbrial chaperone protein [Escherichia coli CE418]
MINNFTEVKVKKKEKLKVVSIFVFCIVTPSFANEKLEIKEKEFSLKLDRSRLIFNENSRGALLTVENSHEYPILVQTRIIDEDRKGKSESLIATPPLFKLNEGEKSKIRIYKKYISNLPMDRETLFWTCTKGIPPTEKDLWAVENAENIEAKKSSLGVNLAVENCIKVFYRPKGIPSVRFDSGKDLVWSIKGDKIKVYNKTPNYMNFKELTIGNRNIENPAYVPPFSERFFDIKIIEGENINWTVITDFGGESQIHHERIK